MLHQPLGSPRPAEPSESSPAGLRATAPAGRKTHPKSSNCGETTFEARTPPTAAEPAANARCGARHEPALGEHPVRSRPQPKPRQELGRTMESPAAASRPLRRAAPGGSDTQKGPPLNAIFCPCCLPPPPNAGRAPGSEADGGIARAAPGRGTLPPRRHSADSSSRSAPRPRPRPSPRPPPAPRPPPGPAGRRRTPVRAGRRGGGGGVGARPRPHLAQLLPAHRAVPHAAQRPHPHRAPVADGVVAAAQGHHLQLPAAQHAGAVRRARRRAAGRGGHGSPTRRGLGPAPASNHQHHREAA